MTCIILGTIVQHDTFFFGSPPFRRKAEGYCFRIVMRGVWFRISSRSLAIASPPTVFRQFLLKWHPEGSRLKDRSLEKLQASGT